MTINWIRCDEQMPSGSRVILRNLETKELLRISPEWVNKTNIHKYEWIPYTHAAWKEVNK